MRIQINTDHNIECHEALTDHVRNVVEGAVSPFSDHITRIKVHLADENGPGKGHKEGLDKRCMMEIRLEGHHPLAVTAHAATVHQAIDGAADKLVRVVGNTLGQQRDHKHRHNAIEQVEETPPEA